MILYLFCFCFSIVLARGHIFSSEQAVAGYPSTLLGDECPGSTKPAVIAKSKYKFIKFYVYGINAPSYAKPNVYYHTTMTKLAQDPNIDWKKRTMIYLPGWMDNIRAFPMGKVMQLLYRKLGYNVIIIEMLKFMMYEYPKAARLIKATGLLVGEMLAEAYFAQPKMDPKKLDLVGLSLGGQTMGFVAKAFKNRTGIKVARLTGMDPAGPCFKNVPPESRVDESDADFVDLILTSIDGFGFASPVGHVNVYVNGGEYQPGDFYWMMCGMFCSHARGYELWMATFIRPHDFLAIKCDSVQDARDKNCFDRKPMETIEVGPFVNRTARGIYYLSTTNFFPYAMGEKGLKKENEYFYNKMSKVNSQKVLRL